MTILELTNSRHDVAHITSATFLPLYSPISTFALNYLTLILLCLDRGGTDSSIAARRQRITTTKKIINVNLEGLALVACSRTLNDDGYGACIRDKSHEGDGTDINCVSSRPCFYTCWKNVFTIALLQKNKAHALFSVSYCFIIRRIITTHTSRSHRGVWVQRR